MLTVPFAAQDDLIIEYKDEYGRDRRGRKSEIPPNLWPEYMRAGGDEDDDDDMYVISLSLDHVPMLIISTI